ncbi:hypothetical protein ACFSX9_12760 [Flavobacterium ardleyense]|uniref:Lipoprotein n=1 Tax=Flavobacterium ardleyense TaxID=2038737 RepID=A0ABW5ZB95_9FLAO
MRKIALTFASITFLVLASCNDKKEPVEVIEKTVVVEKEVEVPAKPVEVVKEEPGTSISVGKDGVEISTKDKKKNVEIDINTGKKKD